MSNTKKASGLTLRFTWMSPCSIHRNRHPDCTICAKGWWEDTGKEAPDAPRQT